MSFLAPWITALAALTGLTAATHAQCGSWSPSGQSTGLDNTIWAMTTHDFDGDSPAPASLVAIGFFGQAAKVGLHDKVAGWDGAHWFAMGDGLPRLGYAYAVVSHDPDGPGPFPPMLVVGGESIYFPKAYAWSGSTWNPLPSLNDSVRAMASYDPDGPGPLNPELIVGGAFNGFPRGIARWAGEYWSELDIGVNGTVTAMTVFDADGAGPGRPSLIVAGRFTLAGGFSTKNVARWDGDWHAFLPDVGPADIRTLASWDPDGQGPANPILLAGGGSGVSRWDGAAWISMPGITGIHDIHTYDPDGLGPANPILVACSYRPLSPVLSRWDGAQWISIPTSPPDDGVFALEDFRGEMMIGGAFLRLGDIAGERIARWNGERLAPLTDAVAPDDKIMDFAVFDADGDGPNPAALIATGDFVGLAGQPMNGIAQWDGVTWQSLAGGLTAPVSQMVRALAIFDLDGAGPNPPRLIAAGRFSEAGGVPVSNVASWDGSAWSPMGSAITSYVMRMFAADPDGPGGPASSTLYAYVSTLGLCRWNGSDWDQLVMPGGYHAVVPFDLDGDGPLPVENITMSVGGVFRFNGSELLPVGEPFSGGIMDLTVVDHDGNGPLPPTLYAGGNFYQIGAEAVNYLARWDGDRWVGLPSTTTQAVNNMATFDPDGPGPQPTYLVVNGPFYSVGSLQTESIALWSGTRWCKLGAGLQGSEISPGMAFAAIEFDADGPGPTPPALVAGGDFDFAGGLESSYFAHWTGGVAPYVTDQPADQHITLGATARFSITAAAISGPLSYRWLKDGQPLFDDRRITGAATANLSIADVSESDGGSYECEIADSCAANASFTAELLLVSCPVDFNGDGVLDFADYLEFLNLFDVLDPRVDFNGDGVIDFGDYLEFLNLFDAGC